MKVSFPRSVSQTHKGFPVLCRYFSNGFFFLPRFLPAMKVKTKTFFRQSLGCAKPRILFVCYADDYKNKYPRQQTKAKIRLEEQ